ncbi:hypothetical protein MYCTH_2042312, partial [Thermothelomyces thermophilus ATCC 42464]
ARTGAISLRDFLFKVQVPGVSTPYCAYSQGKETIEHLVVWCPNPPRSRTDLDLVLRGIGARNHRLARRVLRWLIDLRRLPEYYLVGGLDRE